jgi:hypothetical protein
VALERRIQPDVPPIPAALTISFTSAIEAFVVSAMALASQLSRPALGTRIARLRKT